MIPPYRPRWLNKFYAAVNGCFWLPCPICGENFGGHEVKTMGLMLSWESGKCVCRKPDCISETKRRNEVFMATHPFDGTVGPIREAK